MSSILSWSPCVVGNQTTCFIQGMPQTKSRAVNKTTNKLSVKISLRAILILMSIVCQRVLSAFVSVSKPKSKFTFIVIPLLSSASPMTKERAGTCEGNSGATLQRPITIGRRSPPQIQYPEVSASGTPALEMTGNSVSCPSIELVGCFFFGFYPKNGSF